MAGLAGPLGGSSRTPGRSGARRDALVSVLLALWFPFAVALVPTVGDAVGLTGYGGALDLVRWAIVAIVYFGPFVAGLILGWRAARGGLHGVAAASAWVGLAANAVIIVISLGFVAGEFTNPH
ncbi:MAG: hypothetical protein MUE82_09700 [Chloroflexi bacterium]|nr:hypothetical protein [Chloroflexota bacterium]